jgi:hypothetical protein
MGNKMKVNWKKWLLIVLGTVSWSWTMVKSGWIYSYGMGFWGANGHDGVWHIALSEGLARGSLAMPVFAGSPLQNYHIGFDLILALLNRLSGIPINNLYFQAAPPIFAILIGFLTYRFVFLWTKSDKAAFISTFFTYFGGSLAWMIGKGESAFWSQEAISTLINPPFALSLIVVLLGMMMLLKEKKGIKDYLLSIFLFGILIEIKSYAGILAVGGLLAASIYGFIASRSLKTLYVFIGALAISFVLYLPFNSKSAGLISWWPFWFLESMIASSDRLYLPKLAEAMSSFKYQHVIRKFVPTYGLVFIAFVVGNFGTRMVFLFRRIKRVREIDIFMYSIIAAGILIPTFFVQKGAPWNTIQFIYYSLFLSGIIAGAVLASFNKLLVIIILALTIPTTIITLKDVYIPGRPPAMLPGEELDALNFLKNQPGGVILTYPFDSRASGVWNTAPKPLYLYTSTAYVSAFSGHPTFLEDEVNLDITGYDWGSRRVEVLNWYRENNQAEAKEFLKANTIKYVYWVKPQRAFLGDKQLGLTNIYENSSVVVYRVEQPQD